MTQAADIIRNRRRAFAAPGGFHDRLVRALATGLPIGVGIIVAVMVVAPLSPRGEVSFLLDRNKVAMTNERLSVNDATYRGEDAKGRAFSVTAGSAVQRTAAEPIVTMDRLVARILLAEGPAELTAQDGIYNFDEERVIVRGPVNFTAADGYRMVTHHVEIDLKGQRVTGSGGVEGAIPAGTFSAERITADLAERTVSLDGKARLRMAPGKLRMP